jgi:hypothetical protein
MTYLTTAVGVLGAGLLLNMALMFAVIRRLRRHGEQIARQGGPLRLPAGLAVGSAAPRFSVPAVSGATCSLRDLIGARSLIAFLSPGCLACEWQRPEFKEYARAVPGGAAQVLVIICGHEEAADAVVREMEGVASVTVEPMKGPLQTVFSVSSYPYFYLLDSSGRVDFGGAVVRAMPELQPT